MEEQKKLVRDVEQAKNSSIHMIRRKTKGATKHLVTWNQESQEPSLFRADVFILLKNMCSESHAPGSWFLHSVSVTHHGKALTLSELHCFILNGLENSNHVT